MSSKVFLEEINQVKLNRVFEKPVFIVNCERVFLKDCLFLSDVVVWEGHGVELLGCRVQGSLFMVGGKGYNIASSHIGKGFLIRNCEHIAVIASTVDGVGDFQNIRGGYIVSNVFCGDERLGKISHRLPVIEIMKILRKRLQNQ